MIFVDVAPEHIYLTIFPNFTEDFYKNKEKCAPYFPTKTVTWRKKVGAFKLDTTVAINEKNILNNYTLKIQEDTNFEKIKEFIELLIK